MRIDFFEEFPDQDLEKAKVIGFRSTVYIAAHSLAEFDKFRKRLGWLNPGLEAAYWPILPKSYWISPFSCTAELKKLKRELASIRSPTRVLLDLELPFTHKSLFLRNMLSFSRNKRIIRDIFRTAKKDYIGIVTAEYPISNRLMQKKMRWLGVSYPEFRTERCVMMYTSMIKRRAIRNQVRDHVKRHADLTVGLGTIAVGILGNEPILSPAELEKDLNFLEQNRIKRAVIFRLGGIDEEYLKVIKKFV